MFKKGQSYASRICGTVVVRTIISECERYNEDDGKSHRYVECNAVQILSNGETYTEKYTINAESFVADIVSGNWTIIK